MITNVKAHIIEPFFIFKQKKAICNIISIFKNKKNIKRNNMKNNLILINNNSVEFKKENGKVYVSSRDIANVFGKEHSKILRDIRALPQDDFNQANFGLVEYTDKKGEKRPEYLLTRDGFSMLVMGFTGEKAYLWKVSFIEAFNKLEQTVKETVKSIQAEKPKSQTAKIQTAKLLMKLADKYKDNKEYSQVLDSYAVKELTGQELLPLPAAEEKYYSATDIAYELGTSSNQIGRLSNIHKLKTDRYGKWFYDKAKYCDKQIETFKYNQTGYEKLKSLLSA